MDKYQLLTVEEVAEKLRIPRSSAYYIVKQGKLPSHKIGKHYRISQADYDAYFLQMRSAGIGERRGRPKAATPEREKAPAK